MPDPQLFPIPFPFQLLLESLERLIIVSFPNLPWSWRWSSYTLWPTGKHTSGDFWRRFCFYEKRIRCGRLCFLLPFSCLNMDTFPWTLVAILLPWGKGQTIRDLGIAEWLNQCQQPAPPHLVMWENKPLFEELLLLGSSVLKSRKHLYLIINYKWNEQDLTEKAVNLLGYYLIC